MITQYYNYAMYIARYVNQHIIIMPVGESDYGQAYMCMYGKTAVFGDEWGLYVWQGCR